MKKINLMITFITFSLLFTQDIQLELANLDSTDDVYIIDVLMTSSVEIAGYQFLVTGGILSNANGGLTADNQFTVTSSELGMVLAFDFMGGVIPAGEGTLVQLAFSEITQSEICIEESETSDF